MIRINLLPVRTEVRRQYGKQQLLLGVLLVGVEIAVLFSLYSQQKQRVEEHDQRANELQAEVNELNEQNRIIDELNAQKTHLEGLANVLQALEANRAGPVRVLDELKEMLNPPANDLQRVAQDRREWDTRWDPRSVWLTSFIENNGAVEIKGKALTNDDVAEFTVRLASSPYFSGVQLRRTSAATAPGLGAVFDFDLSATVNYGSTGAEGGAQ